MNSPGLGVICVIVAALSQGAGVVAQRWALRETDALVGTLLRMAPALAVLLAMQTFSGGRTEMRTLLLDRRAVLALAAAAFFGTFLGVLLLSVGTKYASKAGVATALSSTFPIWVIPISRLFLKERTNWKCVLCTITAVVAIGLMLAGRSEDRTPGPTTARTAPTHHVRGAVTNESGLRSAARSS